MITETVEIVENGGTKTKLLNLRTIISSYLRVFVVGKLSVLSVVSVVEGAFTIKGWVSRGLETAPRAVPMRQNVRWEDR